MDYNPRHVRIVMKPALIANQFRDLRVFRFSQDYVHLKVSRHRFHIIYLVA